MASDHQEKQPKKFEHGVRDMVSAIMSRIPDLHHKPGSSSHNHHQDHDDERGVRVVTLAGTNIGASLKTDQSDHEKSGVFRPDGVFFGEEDGESDSMNTYVNSNFQAINNSIMMGGKYEANDPGVHLDITDVFENNIKGKFHKHGKKGKIKKKAIIEKEKAKVKAKKKDEESSSSSDDDEDDSESSSDGKKVKEQKGRKMGPKEGKTE